MPKSNKRLELNRIQAIGNCHETKNFMCSNKYCSIYRNVAMINP